MSVNNDFIADAVPDANTDYEDNMNTSFDFQPQTPMIDNAMSDSPPTFENTTFRTYHTNTSDQGATALASIEHRIDQLERLTCTVFDAIRQLSHQVYSVDTKLTEILNQGTAPMMNSMNLIPQPGTPGMAGMAGLTGQGTDPNANTQMQVGLQIPGTAMADKLRFTWDDRALELKRYKEANGHCDVPQVYDSGLGTWVSAQRSQYKRFSIGKTSSMTTQRKDALETLGFSWSLRKRYSWDERFGELRVFSAANQGSCDVPNEGVYKALWAWCHNQRDTYQKGFDGIPAERVAMMERIGFRWVSDSPVGSIYFPSSADSSSYVHSTGMVQSNGIAIHNHSDENELLSINI